MPQAGPSGIHHTLLSFSFSPLLLSSPLLSDWPGPSLPEAPFPLAAPLVQCQECSRMQMPVSKRANAALSCRSARLDPKERDTAQRSTAQQCTTQHNTTQHNTTQHNTAQSYTYIYTAKSSCLLSSTGITAGHLTAGHTQTWQTPESVQLSDAFCNTRGG